MPEVKTPNSQTKDSVPRSTFSQNNQKVAVQFNAAADIIFGGYSHSRSALPFLDQGQALKRYLSHMIGSNQRLPLQGIRSSNELVGIELEKIYVTLHTITKKSRTEEERWLGSEARVLPGEALRQEMRSCRPPQKQMAKMELKVQQALKKHRRLVVVGDPGCGKTTLLCYLAVTYARNWVETPKLVQKRLGLSHPRLPILLPSY